MPCKESPIFPFHISVECDVGVDIRRQTQILIGHVISDGERFSLPFWLFSSSLVMAFNSNAFNVNIRYVNPQNSFYIRRRIGFSGYRYMYTKNWQYKMLAVGFRFNRNRHLFLFKLMLDKHENVFEFRWNF